MNQKLKNKAKQLTRITALFLLSTFVQPLNGQSILTSVNSSNSSQLDYSITGLTSGNSYDIYYTSSDPSSTYSVGDNYSSMGNSDNFTASGSSESGTSSVIFTYSATYYAILVSNYTIVAMDATGASISGASPSISLTTNSSDASTLNYSISGITNGSMYSIYYFSSDPSSDDNVGSSFSYSSYVSNSSFTSSGTIAAGTSSPFYSSGTYYAVLVDNDGTVAAIDATGATATAPTISITLTTNSSDASTIDYSISGLSSGQSYTLNYYSSDPSSSETVGSSQSGSADYSSSVYASGSTASGTSNPIYTSGTYYGVLVDQNNSIVAALESTGASATAPSISISLSTNTSNSATLDYSITGASTSQNYTIYYTATDPTNNYSVGSSYSSMSNYSDYLYQPQSSSNINGTSSANFVYSSTYYAILVNNGVIAALDNTGASITASTVSVTTSSNSSNSLDYSITGLNSGTEYYLYYTAMDPTDSVGVGGSYNGGSLYDSFTPVSTSITNSSSGVTFDYSATYYAILLDDNSVVAAIDFTGTSVSGLYNIDLSFSVNANDPQKLDYSLSGLNMSDYYSIYTTTSDPSTSFPVGSSYNGNLTNIVSFSATSSSYNGTSTQLSDNTYYGVLVDQNSFVAAIESDGVQLQGYSFSLSTSPYSSGADIGIDGNDYNLPNTFSWLWQESTDGTTWSNVSSGNGGSNYWDADYSMATNGRYYRLVIIDSYAWTYIYDNNYSSGGTQFLSPCSGIPDNGITSASSSSGDQGDATTLSVSGITAAAGLNYQWQSSSDNSTFTDISNENSVTYSTTISSSTVYYRRKTTCSNSSQFAFSWSASVAPSTMLGGNSSTNYVYDGTIWSQTPGPTDNVTFTGSYTVTGHEEYGSVIITGTTVRISPNASLTINGNLYVDASSTLTSESSSSGYSQLLVTGQLRNDGTITQESTLSGTGAVGVSSPMKEGMRNNQNIDTTAFYLYNASTGSYTQPSTVNNPGIGYYGMVAVGGVMSTAGNYNVSGTPITHFTHSLGYTLNQAAGGSGSGWNLLGNPYMAQLDWSTLAKTNINDAIYIWDRSGGKYKYYVNGVATPSGTYISSVIGSDLIPPMHAFWVQATSSGATITSSMADNASVSTSPAHFNKTSYDNIIVSVQEFMDSSNVDATWIINNIQSSKGFDGETDAWKMFNYGTHNVYTSYNGEDLAINAMDLSDSVSIPISLDGLEGNTPYILNVDQIVDQEFYQVWLEDRCFETNQAVGPQGYTFTKEPYYGKATRFVLHVIPADNSTVNVGLEETNIENIAVYSDGISIHIIGNAGKFNSYRVIAANGQTISQGSINNELNIAAPLVNGVYIVQLVGNDGQLSRKIAINK